jgi:uncharacterized membrane protein YkvA (DUF1232 family)
MAPRSQHRGASQASALPSPQDFERHLEARAATVAPADVTALLAQGELVRSRLSGERAVHPALAQRARVAFHLLADHARGACPQIPYQTVSMLAAALFYYLEPMDVVPDFIPRAGTADDALVLDIAWRRCGAGVQRYIDWKGLTPSNEPTSPQAIRMPPPKARARSRARAPKPRAAKGRAKERPKERKSARSRRGR